MASKTSERCRFVGLAEASTAFVKAASGTQGQGHIKPLHWYTACRLVIEGGFHPNHIIPHPPFSVRRASGRYLLTFDEAVATGEEATVFGGLKTKDIDVVVDVPRLGPCLAVSIKGTLKSFRNLTNRLEEAVGDCTNVHIAYPALVYGFLSMFRANREGLLPPDSAFLTPDERGWVQREDLALSDVSGPTAAVQNYAQAMSRLAGRRDLRDDPSRYESIAVALVSPYADTLGAISDSFPTASSCLTFRRFFDAMYRHYDLRFVYGAPNLRRRTERLTWDPDSPVVQDARCQEFGARIGLVDDVDTDGGAGDEC